jgi:hypothetical protein
MEIVDEFLNFFSIQVDVRKKINFCILCFKKASEYIFGIPFRVTAKKNAEQVFPLGSSARGICWEGQEDFRGFRETFGGFLVDIQD